MKRLISILTAAGIMLSHAAFLPNTAGTAAAADFKPVKINATNFPDPMFRAVISGREYDLDGDGTINEYEMIRLRNIHCDGLGIKSLKGIELFPELRGLYCTNNDLTSLDLSGNKLLTGVWCSDNPNLGKIDVSMLPDLLWLYCFNCGLTSLNIDDNPHMAYLECNDNAIKKLNLENNTELEHLICNYCELSSLDLSNNPNLAHLDAIGNKFKKLDVTCCPKMKRLDIWDMPGLGSVDISKCEGLQYYCCANNGVTKLDISHNPELTKINCSYNQIEKLDLSNAPKLSVLYCNDNPIKTLDVSNCPKLHFLQTFNNGFTKLAIGDCPFLVKTYQQGVKDDVMGVAHEWVLDFGGDDSTQGDSKYFLSFDDKVKLDLKATKPAQETSVYREDDNTDEKYLVTREQAIVTLYKMAGSPKPTLTKSRFTDVKNGKDYTAALLWGEQNNICTGFPDISSDTFGVGKWVTRQDLALMLMRYSEAVGYNRSIDFGRSDDFSDYYDIDAYAWEAITWAATWNIMIGKGDPNAPKEQRRIDPHGKATKAEFREMLIRMLEVNNDTADIFIGRLPGDVNDDGEVNIKDITLLKQSIAKWNVIINAKNADVNGDNKVDIKDITILKQYLAKWKVTLR